MSERYSRGNDAYDRDVRSCLDKSFPALDISVSAQDSAPQVQLWPTLRTRSTPQLPRTGRAIISYT